MNLLMPNDFDPEGVMALAAHALRDAQDALRKAAKLADASIEAFDERERLEAAVIGWAEIAELEREMFDQTLLIFAERGYTPAASVLRLRSETRRKARMTEPQQ